MWALSYGSDDVWKDLIRRSAHALRLGRVMPLPLTMRLYGGTDKLQHGYADHYQRHLRGVAGDGWPSSRSVSAATRGQLRAEASESGGIISPVRPSSASTCTPRTSRSDPASCSLGRPSLRRRLDENARPAPTATRSRNRRRLAQRAGHLGRLPLPVPAPSPGRAVRHRGSAFQLLAEVRRCHTGTRRQRRRPDQATRRRSAGARRDLHPKAAVGTTTRGGRTGVQCGPRVSRHRVHREGPRAWHLSAPCRSI